MCTSVCDRHQHCQLLVMETLAVSCCCTQECLSRAPKKPAQTTALAHGGTCEACRVKVLTVIFALHR